MKTSIEYLNVLNIIHTIPCNVKNYNAKSSRDVQYIVMHYTANQKDTAVANCKYFNSAYRGASAHFFVDEKTIYHSVKLKDIAWHVGAKSYKHKSCRNANSIGIEMCTSGNARVAEPTKTRAVALVVYLFQLMKWTADEVDTRLLRHWDVTGKWCPAQMAGDNNGEWLDFKNAVRKALVGEVAKDETENTLALVFDANYYGERYKDLGNAGLKTTLQLTEHFIQFGMNELRQGIASFDPVVYKAYNADLQVAFGNNNKMYYMHYINYGHKENRVHV